MTKMKRIAMAAMVAGAALMMGCASTYPVGMAYTNVDLPGGVTGNTGSSKQGTAMCKSYLGMVAIGDASVQAAAKSAGITKIHHVDWHATSILGLIGEYTTTVYGE